MRLRRFSAIVVLLLVMSFLLAGCQCRHEYKEYIQEATCKQAGYIVYTCLKCGDSFQTELPALEHSWVAATCACPKECSECGATEGEALGHSVSNGVCMRCGEVLSTTKSASKSIEGQNSSSTSQTPSVTNAANTTVAANSSNTSNVSTSNPNIIVRGLPAESSYMGLTNDGPFNTVTIDGVDISYINGGTTATINLSGYYSDNYLNSVLCVGYKLYAADGVTVVKGGLFKLPQLELGERFSTGSNLISGLTPGETYYFGFCNY